MHPSEFIDIPQDFFDIFTDNDLPYPPLPQWTPQSLYLRDRYLFSSSLLRPVLNRRSLDFDILGYPPVQEASESTPESPSENNYIRYFECGISARGFTGSIFRYLVESKTLNFALALPYGNLLGNKQLQKVAILSAFDLVRICLSSTKGGTSFGRYQNSSLYFLCDDRQVSYTLVSHKNEILQSGDTIDSLLDFFMLCQDCFDNKPLSWLKV